MKVELTEKQKRYLDLLLRQGDKVYIQVLKDGLPYISRSRVGPYPMYPVLFKIIPKPKYICT